MIFLYPAYFLAFLGLLPLIAVYFLKVRPGRKPVTAFFLWREVFDQKKNTALSNRLREILSLLLMILALVAVVLAMTTPEIASDQRKDLLLIVDNSASMNARDNGRTRLAAAKKTASDIIRSLDANQQAAVATVSMDVQYQSHFTTSPKALIDAVRGIEQSDCPFRSEALDTLAAGAISMDSCRIILISDGCGFNADANDYIELVKVDSEQENIGFLTCDIRMFQSNPVKVGIYYKLASSFDKDIETDIIITYGPEDRIIKVIPVTVKPGINEPEVYTINAGGPGQWKASLDIQDSLANDNIAFLALQPKRPVKIRVESEYKFFLVNSILAFAQTSGDLEYSQENADVVLSNGLIPQAERSIIFGIKESSGWCGQVGKEINNVLAKIKIEDHPVLSNCDIDSMPFIGARDINLPEDSLVIVETSEHVPLIYRVRQGQRVAIVINMDTVESEFYYSAWFPVVVYNCARYLMGRQDTIASACSIGDSISIPTTQYGNETTTVTIGHSNEPFQLSGSSYGPIRKAGFHTLENSSGKWSLGANLFASTETLLDNKDVTDTSRPLNRGRPLSATLAILAVLLLTIECVLYHRCKFG